MKQIIVVSMLLGLLVFLLPLVTAANPAANTYAAEASAVRSAASAAPEQVPYYTAPSAPSKTAAGEETPVKSVSDAQTVITALIGGEERKMSLRDYLIGVVSAEMPASFEPEALKAQAVAARTYTLYKIRVAPSKNHAADVCGDPNCCSAYRSAAESLAVWGGDYGEYMEKVARAVDSTDGVIMTCRSEPILAVFHSSSAGATENSADVWGRALSYLVSVKSPEDAREVPNYHSAVTVSHDDFKATIREAYPDADLNGGSSGWFSGEQRTEGGRLKCVTIGGAQVPGTKLRSLFGLRSACIEITVLENGILLSCTGYGHGAGMSQYGADALAGEGYTFDEILIWYYTGVSVVKE